MEPIRTLRKRRSAPLALGAALVTFVMLLGACASTGASLPIAGGGRPGATGGAAGAPQDRTGSESKGGTGGSAVADPAAPRDQALVIKTGTIQLEVKDLTVLIKARTSIVGLGGYVSGSEQSSGGDHKVASVTYRVPANRWDEALDALKGLATKVVSEQTQAIEVTGQVLDLGARIDNLRASERALQEIMSRATKISEILEVQTRLTEVRGQIEQLATQKAHLEDQAAFGSLTATYDVPVVPVQEAAQKWDPKAEIDRAMAQLIELGQGVATMAIWFAIVLLPVLLLAGLAVGAALIVARRTGLTRRREPDAVV
jgi:hypothetical protein